MCTLSTSSEEATMPIESPSKITPFLWFDTQAEEAADFYLTVFPASKKTNSLKGPDGKTLTVSFELSGLEFTALNGGPQFKFNESVSFFVHCKDQAEIDHYWNALSTDGGQESQCGWLKDKFGLSWQIVPENIMSLVKHPKAFQAMLTMKKLIIAGLEAAAHEG
jgi:predicted 3-demethylubiquinone-9 3-methyltransferase (glyoxalase superfamily)